MSDNSMYEKSMSSTSFSKAYIAVNRFGYGARGDELAKAKSMLSDEVFQYPETFVFPYRLGSLDPAIYTVELFNQLKRLEQQILSPDNQFSLSWLLSKYASMKNKHRIR